MDHKHTQYCTTTSREAVALLNHTYVHTHPSVGITSQLLTPLFLCALILYVSGGTCILTQIKNNKIFGKLFHGNFNFMLFSFLPKNMHFISKNAISCLFLKNVSPSKRVICSILNNLHFPMWRGIAFYALHKSRVLIIPCKANGFCLFMGLPEEIYKCRLVSLSTLEFNFFIGNITLLKLHGQ